MVLEVLITVDASGLLLVSMSTNDGRWLGHRSFGSWSAFFYGWRELEACIWPVLADGRVVTRWSVKGGV